MRKKCVSADVRQLVRCSVYRLHGIRRAENVMINGGVVIGPSETQQCFLVECINWLLTTSKKCVFR